MQLSKAFKMEKCVNLSPTCYSRPRCCLDKIGGGFEIIIPTLKRDMVCVAKTGIKYCSVIHNNTFLEWGDINVDKNKEAYCMEVILHIK